MTNSEKAKEIAENSKQYFYHNEYECGLACALRMAKWKDEQFEKFLRKMCFVSEKFINEKFDKINEL